MMVACRRLMKSAQYDELTRAIEESRSLNNVQKQISAYKNISLLPKKWLFSKHGRSDLCRRKECLKSRRNRRDEFDTLSVEVGPPTTLTTFASIWKENLNDKTKLQINNEATTEDVMIHALQEFKLKEGQSVLSSRCRYLKNEQPVSNQFV